MEVRLRFVVLLGLALAACSPKPRIEWLSNPGKPTQTAAATDRFTAAQEQEYGPMTIYRVRGDGAREPILTENTVTGSSIVVGSKHVWIELTSSLESASEGRIYAAPLDHGRARLVTTSRLYSGLGVVGDDAVFVTNKTSLLDQQSGWNWATGEDRAYELRRVTALGGHEQIVWRFDAAYGAVYDSRGRDIVLLVERRHTPSYARLTLP